MLRRLKRTRGILSNSKCLLLPLPNQHSHTRNTRSVTEIGNRSYRLQHGRCFLFSLNILLALLHETFYPITEHFHQITFPDTILATQCREQCLQCSSLSNTVARM